MSVRMKLTRSKTGSRRAHHSLKAERLVKTPAGARLRHFADPDTGMYRGKKLFETATESAAKSARSSKKKDAKAAKSEADSNAAEQANDETK